MRNQEPLKYVATVGVTAMAFLAVNAAHDAWADGIPTVPLYYSGYLEQNGYPVTTEVNLNVSLFDTTNTLRCQTNSSPVTPVNGYFRVALPNDCVTAVAQHPDLDVKVEVNGAVIATTRLGAVPYAVEALRASQASGELERRLQALESPYFVEATITFATEGPQVGGGFGIPAAADWTLENTDAPGATLAQIACLGQAATGVTCDQVEESLGISFSIENQDVYEVCVSGVVSALAGQGAAQNYVQLRLVETSNASDTLVGVARPTRTQDGHYNSIDTSLIFTYNAVTLCELFSFDPGQHTVRVQARKSGGAEARVLQSWQFRVTRR